MDLARLRDEVLAPARAGKPVLYRAYSCREGAYLPVQQLAAQPLVILEGSYSHHPLLAPYEDFRVFMTCSDAEQTRRLQAREGDRYPDFAARWVPLEEAYFTQHNIEGCRRFRDGHHHRLNARHKSTCRRKSLQQVLFALCCFTECYLFLYIS